jgi:hypothetical protein
MQPIKPALLVAAVLLLLLLLPGSRIQANEIEASGNWGGYTFTTLPVPGVPWIAGSPRAVSINNAGDIIINGSYQVSIPDFGLVTRSKGFLRRSDGTLEEISFPLEAGQSVPTSINDRGQIAGIMRGVWPNRVYPRSVDGAFVRETDGTYHDVYIALFGVVESSSINNNGQVSLSANDDAPCTYFGLILEPNGTRTFVVYPDSCDTHLTGLNDHGNGVGWATPRQGTLANEVAFIWRSGQFNVFAQSPPFLITQDINNFNQIILNGAVLQPDGRTIQLAFPGATTTSAIGMNDKGHVVGFYSGASSSGAFLAIPEGTLTLAPAVATAVTGGVHTITATALDSIGLPVPGVTVHFFVNAGPNSGRTGTAVTNQFGQAIFNYADTGGTGKDEIFAIADNVNSNLAFQTWQTPPESQPPACALTSISTNPKQIQVTTQDSGSGLKAIVVTKRINFTTSIPVFAQGTTAPVMVTATKIDAAQSSTLALQVTDLANNVTTCNFVNQTVLRDSAKPDQVSLTVPGDDHLLHVANGTPGITGIKVLVNGNLFDTLGGLKDGEIRVIDLAAAMKPGNNVITLESIGKPNGTAEIVIHD